MEGDRGSRRSPLHARLGERQRALSRRQDPGFRFVRELPWMLGSRASTALSSARTDDWASSGTRRKQVKCQARGLRRDPGADDKESGRFYPSTMNWNVETASARGVLT